MFMSTAPKHERWSRDRKPSPHVPVYVPPELFRFGGSKATELFLLRAQFADMQRVAETKTEDEWYARKRKREDPARYNAKGERVNTPQNIFKKKRNDVLQEIMRFSEMVNETAQRGESGIVHKIYFTKEQMQGKVYAAILGARGRTHQELQTLTGCRITLMGRGISDVLKVRADRTEQRAGDDDEPHCHITAPDEVSLSRCVERINFILSDKAEAVEFRNEKRKEVAQINGTFNPDTWKGDPIPGQQTGAMSAAPARNSAATDEVYEEFKKQVG